MSGAAVLSRSIYCDVTGNFMLVETPVGLIPPPQIGDLIYQGTPQRLFAVLNYSMDQKDIAALVGVGQQAVSRYVSGASEPRLSVQGWRALVKGFHSVFSQCKHLDGGHPQGAET